MQRLVIFLPILIAICQSSSAAPTVFQDHNFSIEFPVNWQTLDRPPAQTLAAAQTLDGSKSVLITATKLPLTELPTASRSMIAGAKQSMIDKGWQVTNEHQISVSGVPFHAFTTRVSASASIITYVGVAGNVGYMLQGVCNACDVSSNPEVKRILNSFHLLSPPSPPIETSRPKTAAYRTGYILGPVPFVALIGVGVVLVIRRTRNKRGKEVTMSDPPRLPESQKTLFHYAALISLFSPLTAWALAIVINVMIGRSLNPERADLARQVVGVIAFLLFPVGFLAGVVALLGMRKVGRKRIIGRAIVGMVFCGVALIAFIPLLPKILREGFH